MVQNKSLHRVRRPGRHPRREAPWQRSILAIRGGTVVTAADIFRADIGVQAGRIVTVSDAVEGAAREIDASGLLVLPGGIDSHVHIAQPAGPDIVMADDFASATAAAAAGGNTCVMPFAMQIRGTSLRACVEEYRAKAEGECLIDVAFHLIISDPSPEVLGQELPALLKAGYTSFKVFMTYDDLVLNDRELLEVFDVARRERALVMVHAEGYDAIKFMTERLEREGSTAPYYHAVSRPEIVEREAAHRAISHAAAGRRADHDRARLRARGDGADPLGAEPRSQDLRRDLPAIHHADGREPARPEHGHERRQIRVLAAAPRRREPGRHLGGLEVRACSRPSRRTIARSATTARRAS